MKNRISIAFLFLLTAAGVQAQFRRFTLTLLDAYKEYYRNGEASVIDNVIWVEGIGSAAGPFCPWSPLPPRNSIFTSCCIGKTCIFGDSDFYNAEVVVSVNNILSKRKDNEDNNFDLTGRRLNSIPEKGMYIQGGKKWIVK